MNVIGGMSAGVAKKQKKEIRRQIEAQHRHQARALLATLRQHIRTLKLRRREAMREAVTFCRTERAKAKQRGKDLRARALLELREARRQDKLAARGACSHAKSEVRSSAASESAKARSALHAERSYQAELRRVEHRHKEREKGTRTALERRQESDDSVRNNLPHDLLPLWERVKRSIRGSDRMSRTEAFLLYAEENPSDVFAEQSRLAEEEVKRLIRAEHKLAKAVVRRRPPTPAELAAIPF